MEIAVDENFDISTIKYDIKKLEYIKNEITKYM
jgi:hypothetical protein